MNKIAVDTNVLIYLHEINPVSDNNGTVNTFIIVRKFADNKILILRIANTMLYYK